MPTNKLYRPPFASCESIRKLFCASRREHAALSKKVIVVATFSDSCHCNILCLVRKLLAARVGVYFVGELQSNPAEGSFIKSPLPLLDEGGGRVGKVVKTRHAFSIE